MKKILKLSFARQMTFIIHTDNRLNQTDLNQEIKKVFLLINFLHSSWKVPVFISFCSQCRSHILVMFYLQFLFNTLKMDCFLLIQEAAGKLPDLIRCLPLGPCISNAAPKSSWCSFPTQLSNWTQLCGMFLQLT